MMSSTGSQPSTSDVSLVLGLGACMFLLAACTARGAFEGRDSGGSVGVPDGSSTDPSLGDSGGLASCIVDRDTDLYDDGSLDEHTRTYFDATGFPIRVQQDGDPVKGVKADGAVDHAWTTTRTFETDSQGRSNEIWVEQYDSRAPTRKRLRHQKTATTLRTEVDNEDDGIFDSVTTRVDSVGSYRVEQDVDLDGTVDVTRSYWLDGESRIVVSEVVAGGQWSRSKWSWQPKRLVMETESLAPTQEWQERSEADLEWVGGIARVVEKRDYVYVVSREKPAVVHRFVYTGACTKESETQLPR